MMYLPRLLVLSLLLFSASAQAFLPGPTKWPQASTIMYVGDLSGNSLSGTSWKAAFNDAATGWNNQGDFTFFISDSSVSGNCSATDLRNYVAFSNAICESDFGASTLAVTLTFTFNNTPSATIKTDILFNSAFSWDVYHGPTLAVVDFRRVAAHELGHALGLDHETTVSALMAPFIGDIEYPTSDDLGGLVALYGASAPNPNADPPMILTLESPAFNGVMNGISNFQGWVVSKTRIKKIALYVDGTFIGNIPTGGVRPDVGHVYSQYPDSGNAGFSMAWNYAKFTPGEHHALVRATDINGFSQEARATFNTIEFNNTEFFFNPDAVNLRNASARFPQATELGHQMIIDNAVIDGKTYSLLLLWNTGSQKFEITSISPN